VQLVTVENRPLRSESLFPSILSAMAILRQLSTPLGERKEVVQLHPAHLASATLLPFNDCTQLRLKNLEFAVFCHPFDAPLVEINFGRWCLGWLVEMPHKCPR
jgi:hypothetical protein